VTLLFLGLFGMMIEEVNSKVTTTRAKSLCGIAALFSSGRSRF
jgi:hypothetical protein